MFQSNSKDSARYAAAAILAALSIPTAAATQVTIIDQFGTTAGERYGTAVDMTRNFGESTFSDGLESLVIGAPTDGVAGGPGRIDVATLNTLATPLAFGVVSYAPTGTFAQSTALFGSALDFYRTDLFTAAGTAGAPGDATFMPSSGPLQEFGGRSYLVSGNNSLPRFSGATLGDAYGASVALVQNANLNTAYFIAGAPQPGTGPGYLSVDGAASLYQGTTPNALFGSSMEAVGDIDGDGIEELIVGAPGEGPGGTAYLFSGNSFRLGFPFIMNVIQGAPGDQLGSSVGRAGDVDGDGKGDYWVCSPNFGVNEGRILVYSGATHSVILDMRGTTDVGAAGGKDVNGDGTPDFVIASRSAQILVTVRSGVDGSLLASIPRDALDDGSPVTSLSLGDINGDRRSEFAIGQGLYSNATQSEVGRVQLIELAGNVGIQYCYSGDMTGAGEFSTLRGSGSGVLGANNLTIDALGLMPGSVALFLAADGFAMIPPGSGTLGNICVGGAVGRYNAQVATADASGQIAFPVDLTNLPTPSGTLISATVGSTWYFQALHSDRLPSGVPIRHFTPGLAVLVL